MRGRVRANENIYALLSPCQALVGSGCGCVPPSNLASPVGWLSLVAIVFLFPVTAPFSWPFEPRDANAFPSQCCQRRVPHTQLLVSLNSAHISVNSPFLIELSLQSTVSVC